MGFGLYQIQKYEEDKFEIPDNILKQYCKILKSEDTTDTDIDYYIKNIDMYIYCRCSLNYEYWKDLDYRQQIECDYENDIIKDGNFLYVFTR